MSGAVKPQPELVRRQPFRELLHPVAVADGRDHVVVLGAHGAEARLGADLRPKVPVEAVEVPLRIATLVLPSPLLVLLLVPPSGWGGEQEEVDRARVIR